MQKSLMHFGPRTSEAEAIKIMDQALEMGINFFDTANVYGSVDDRGKSEIISGRLPETVTDGSIDL